MAKTISAAMQTHLNGEVTSITTCWAIVRTPNDESMLFFTEHDQDIDLTASAPFGTGRQTFLNANYVAIHGATRTAISASEAGVDNLEMEAILLASGITSAAIIGGQYDGANIYVFKVNWDDISDGVIRMPGSGVPGEFTIEVRKGTYKVELRGLGQLITARMGELYQPVCRADLFDKRCRKDEGSFDPGGTLRYIQHGTINTVTDKRTFTAVLVVAVFNDQPLTITNHSFESGVQVGNAITGWTEGVVQSANQWSTTATGQGASMTALTSIVIEDNSPDVGVLVRTAGSWIADGFEPDMIITIANSASNNGTHTVLFVSQYEMSLTTTLTAEAAQTDLAIVSGSPQSGANVLEADFLPPHDLQRQFDIFSDTATISTGGANEPTTVEIDAGKVIVELTVAVYNERDEEDRAQIGIVCEDGSGTELGTFYSPDIRSGQHLPFFGGDGFEVEQTFKDVVRTFQLISGTRKIRVSLRQRKEPKRSGTQGTTCGIKFDNVRAIVKPQVVLTRGQNRDLNIENDWFDNGVVSFVSGLNINNAREIDTYTQGTTGVNLFLPLPFNPVVGDQFTIYPGCKKRHIEDCATKFDNAINHRGDPYVPGQDAAFSAADQR